MEELFLEEQYKWEDQHLENLWKKEDQKVESLFPQELLHLKWMFNLLIYPKHPNLSFQKLLGKHKQENFKF